MKQLLEEGVDVDDSEEVNLLHAGHTPIMIRGEDGVLYQVSMPFSLLCLLSLVKLGPF